MKTHIFFLQKKKKKEEKKRNEKEHYYFFFFFVTKKGSALFRAARENSQIRFCTRNYDVAVAEARERSITIIPRALIVPRDREEKKNNKVERSRISKTSRLRLAVSEADGRALNATIHYSP